jgi:hypothetical protein
MKSYELVVLLISENYFCGLWMGLSNFRKCKHISLKRKQAISQAVAKLGCELGQSLLERVGSGVLPTAA